MQEIGYLTFVNTLSYRDLLSSTVKMDHRYMA
jgi:hypothetical protein